MSPSVASWRSASRTGVLLTPNCAATSACTSRVPPGIAPERIAWRSAATTD